MRPHSWEAAIATASLKHLLLEGAAETTLTQDQPYGLLQFRTVPWLCCYRRRVSESIVLRCSVWTDLHEVNYFLMGTSACSIITGRDTRGPLITLEINVHIPRKYEKITRMINITIGLGKSLHHKLGACGLKGVGVYQSRRIWWESTTGAVVRVLDPYQRLKVR